eukprot:2018569-Prymnesium_polylepis.1
MSTDKHPDHGTRARAAGSARIVEALGCRDKLRAREGASPTPSAEPEIARSSKARDREVH